MIVFALFQVESVAIGNSGDKIVVRRLIPWGPYTAGAKNFQTLVYMCSKRTRSFSGNGLVLSEIFVFFW